MPTLKWAFPPELRVMTTVPRWSIVHTLTRDSVANHSYYVAMYSHSIAQLIEWQGDYGALLFYALAHDLEETVSGDLVSPVKDEIIDNARARAYLDSKMRERFPFVMDKLEKLPNKTNIVKIVQAADKLDAYIFLLTEKRLGNGVIAPHLPRAKERFHVRWFNLPVAASLLRELWDTAVIPALEMHESNGGAGLF